MIKLLLTVFCFLFTVTGYAQRDCYLGIGGKDDKEIATVFQLNDKQLENLRNWGAELRFRNEMFEMQMKNLLKDHAQSSPEDLMKMSHAYKACLDSIEANMRMLDKRILGTFNSKQYNLYIMLCNQVHRSPIYANGAVD